MKKDNSYEGSLKARKLSEGVENFKNMFTGVEDSFLKMFEIWDKADQKGKAQIIEEYPEMIKHMEWVRQHKGDTGAINKYFYKAVLITMLDRLIKDQEAK
ncbi:MAG: hypothetical protein NT118_06870 [Lentisphaerae bacterium]|nr:hypothetical protein [Lentisphaerota bacterium]